MSISLEEGDDVAPEDGVLAIGTAHGGEFLAPAAGRVGHGAVVVVAGDLLLLFGEDHAAGALDRQILHPVDADVVVVPVAAEDADKIEALFAPVSVCGDGDLGDAVMLVDELGLEDVLGDAVRMLEALFAVVVGESLALPEAGLGVGGLSVDGSAGAGLLVEGIDSSGARAK